MTDRRRLDAIDGCVTCLTSGPGKRVAWVSGFMGMLGNVRGYLSARLTAINAPASHLGLLCHASKLIGNGSEIRYFSVTAQRDVNELRGYDFDLVVLDDTVPRAIPGVIDVLKTCVHKRHGQVVVL